MQRRAVISDDQVVDLPLVFVYDIMHRQLGLDLGEPLAAVGKVLVNNVRGMATHVERLGPITVTTNPSVLDRRVLGPLFIAHGLHSTRIIPARIFITVHEAKLIDLGALLGGQQAERPAHVGELSLPTLVWHFDRIEHRAQCRDFSERAVGMPTLCAA